MGRRHISGTAAASAAAVVLAIGGLVWTARQPKRYSHHFKNGLIVEVLPVQPNDVADRLEWRRWKYHVTLPPNTNALKCSLEVWRDGVPYAPQRDHLGGLGSGGFGSTEFDVSVILRTEHSDWKNDAQMISWVGDGGGGATSKAANPFRNVTISGMSFNGFTNTTVENYVLLEKIYPELSDRKTIGGVPYDYHHGFSLVLKMKPERWPDPVVPAKPGFWQSLFASLGN